EKIRSLLIDPQNKGMDSLTELLLFEASRSQHVQEFIKPHLDEGTWVICDRFADSSLAYQGARKLPLEWVETLNNMVVRDCWPDLTFFLDLSYETGYQRLMERYGGQKVSLDRIEREKEEFFRELRRNYQLLTKGEFVDPSLNGGAERWRYINAEDDFESISAQIWQYVEEFINQGVSRS
ncbi:dTMP kinase, partial [bacterium]|nr:dTMP kinase [bacterium]